MSPVTMPIDTITIAIAGGFQDIIDTAEQDSQYQPTVKNKYAEEKKFNSIEAKGYFDDAKHTLSEGAKKTARIAGNAAGGVTGTLGGSIVGSVLGSIGGKAIGKMTGLNKAGKYGALIGTLAGGVLGGTKGSSTFSKTFAIPSSILSNATGFIKDLGKITSKHKKPLASMALTGAALTGGTYLADKAVQIDKKRRGEKIEEPQQIQYSISISKNVLSKSKSLAKSAKNLLKENKKSIGTMAVLGGAPVIASYASERSVKSDLVKDTSNPKQQKQYSFSRLLKKTPLFKHPLQTISGFANNVAGLGVAGTKNVQKLGKEMIEQGTKSGNKWTKNAGEWIKKNKTGANVATLLPVAAVGSVTYGIGEKVVEKAARTLDKNAFKYQDSQNSEVK